MQCVGSLESGANSELPIGWYGPASPDRDQIECLLVAGQTRASIWKSSSGLVCYE